MYQCNAEKQVHTFVISRLIYYNPILAGCVVLQSGTDNECRH